MTTEPTEFSANVIRLIQAIPRGRVATYGQIAALAGKPHGARGVSWILSSSTKKHKLPWYRVVGSGGKISIPKGSKGHDLQIQLLKKEGVIVTESKCDILKYGWKKQPKPAAIRHKPSLFS
jgi:methylated-DNA-protein-cysteine methyltransferase-like protein